MHKILIAAAEGLPYIKSGGLADVVGSLAPQLTAAGQQCAVVLPLYKKIIDSHPELEKIAEYKVDSGLIHKMAQLYQTKVGMVDYYFIRQDDYFYRDGM